MLQKPHRPPVTHQQAEDLFNQLFAKSEMYYQIPSRTGDFWADSLSPKWAGTRRLRIRLFNLHPTSNHMGAQPVVTSTAEMWLSELKSIVAQRGFADNVKFYVFRGCPSIAIWYISDGKQYYQQYRKYWQTHTPGYKNWYIHYWIEFQKYVNDNVVTVEEMLNDTPWLASAL